MKGEALDRTLWRTRYERGCGRAEDRLQCDGRISETGEQSSFTLTLYVPCMAIGFRNSEVYFLFKFIPVDPLHVSNRLTIHPQEAVYCTWNSGTVPH